jgi:hypothetical protein
LGIVSLLMRPPYSSILKLAITNGCQSFRHFRLILFRLESVICSLSLVLPRDNSFGIIKEAMLIGMGRLKIPTNSIIATCLLSLYVLSTSSWFTSFVSAQGSPTQDNKTPITLIPAITQNTLTIVSLLIGTSSFILGLRIQNLTKSPATTTPISALMNKYFELLILALAIPSVFIIVF